MILAEVKQLDQKNRLHINSQYLDIAGIKENAKVLVSINTNTRTITIKPIDDKTFKDFNI